MLAPSSHAQTSSNSLMNDPASISLSKMGTEWSERRKLAFSPGGDGGRLDI
jgi:hypothetical protein